LKLREAPLATANFSPKQLAKLRGYLDAMPPSRHLYEFKGTMKASLSSKRKHIQQDEEEEEENVIREGGGAGAGETVGKGGDVALSSEEEISLNERNFLLMGATLRNTKWAVGIVVSDSFK